MTTHPLKTGLRTLIFAVLAAMFTLWVGSAVAQDYTPYTQLDEWGKLRHNIVYGWMDRMNHQFANIDSVDVGEEIMVPDGTYRAANLDHFHTHASAYLMRYPGIERAWIEAGRPRGLENISEFLRDYMNQVDPVTTPERQGVAQESNIAETPVATSGSNEQEASVPWYMLLFMVAVAIAFLLFGYGLFMALTHSKKLEEKLDGFIQADRETPRIVEGENDPLLRQDAFSEEPVRTPEAAADHFQRQANIGTERNWRVLDNTVEQVYLNGGPARVSFSGYMGSLGEDSYERQLTFRDTPAWRARIRNTETGEEKEVVSLAPCFNTAHLTDDIEVTKRPKSEENEGSEQDPLVGETLQVVTSIRKEGGREVTMRHPDHGDMEGYLSDPQVPAE